MLTVNRKLTKKFWPSAQKAVNSSSFMCSDYFCRIETKQVDESQLWKWYLFISTYTLINRGTNSFRRVLWYWCYKACRHQINTGFFASECGIWHLKESYDMNKRLSGSLQISLLSSKLRFSAKYIFPTIFSRGNIRLKVFIYQVLSSLNNDILRRVTYLNQSLASENI